MYVQTLSVEARSCNHYCSGKTMSITYCEYVFVALGIQHAMRMHHTAICGLPRSKIFFHIIPKKSLKKNVLFSLQLLSGTFRILRRIKWDVIQNVYWSSCKVPVILDRVYLNLNFLGSFSKNNRMSNLMKIRPAGSSCFMRTDGRDEANSHFS
jgi:hypothetical protein